MKTTIKKILSKLFEKDILYIRVFHKKIEIKNIKTDQEISYGISQTYSNDRMLIADFEIFEQQLKNAIAQSKGHKSVNKSVRIIFQPIDDTVTEFSPVEKRAFLDSCEHAGASHVYVIKGKEKLTNDAIMDIINY